MRLAFFAKGDLLVPVPEARLFVGQPAEYVGRRHELNVLPGQPGYPATPEPFTCDADSEIGARLVLIMRRDGDLIPADEATAAHCGVPFVPHVFTAGVHVPAAHQE